ncbi:MAG: hypothetical protein BWY79_01815 [Actinobacteria bacterium ADurb.Bin444]|nr:MAG: hypothetical protein BWY79_01815 [Actinobacteria bacterium ADurb.Bin444]
MSFLPANDPIYAAIRNTAAKFNTRKEITMPKTEMPKAAPKSSSANAQSAAKKATKAPLPPHITTKQKPAKEEHKDSSRAKRAAYDTAKLFSPADIAQAMGISPKAVRAQLRRIEKDIPKSLLIQTKEVRWGFSEVEAVVKLLKGE